MLTAVIIFLTAPTGLHLASVTKNPTLECTCTSTHFEDTRFSVKCQRNSSGQWNVNVNQQATTAAPGSATPFRLFVEQSTVTCEQEPFRAPRPNYIRNLELGSYYKFHTEGISWERARRRCAQEGAHLAIIDTPKEAEELKKMFAEHPKIADVDWLNNQAYIGVHDQADEGNFVTVFGNSLTYQNWENGEPNNGGGKEEENCVTMVRNGKMNDVHCELPLPFFCEQKI
ncbi:hemolymph lipopolysaccharide-binding protein [Anabrus simplex]|uniref:hemolymph lipopolysaccharide-binding protein n=1 Tax=Anabrus simplex TaxID=316456 RepID=UPI0035A37E12